MSVFRCGSDVGFGRELFYGNVDLVPECVDDWIIGHRRGNAIEVNKAGDFIVPLSVFVRIDRTNNPLFDDCAAIRVEAADVPLSAARLAYDVGDRYALPSYTRDASGTIRV